MFTHYRTSGIFLKKEDRGETDQVFTVYTKDFGKLEIVGRSIRKIKSKLRQGAELFYFSEIEFIQGKNQKTLTDSILIDKFKGLRNFPEKIEIACKVSENLDNLSGVEEKDDKIWDLLSRVFQQLDNLKLEIKDSLEIFYYYFLWNLFSLLGYRPELYYCPVCGRKLLPETFWFSPKEGGIVCWQCLKKFDEKERKEAKEIKVDAVKILRTFLSKDYSVARRLKTTKEAKDNLKEVSDSYLLFLKEEFPKKE